jgi:hypothetical protein
MMMQTAKLLKKATINSEVSHKIYFADHKLKFVVAFGFTFLV